MRIEYNDMDNFVIYLYDNKKQKNVDDIKEDPEEFFKNIFFILKHKYKFNLDGLYKVELFPCINYGIIIEVKKVIDDFYQNYTDGVDLKIKINDDSLILFEIDDLLLLDDVTDISIFRKNDKFYVLYLTEISDKDLYKILEHSNIVYGDKCLEIINPYNLFVDKNLSI